MKAKKQMKLAHKIYTLINNMYITCTYYYVVPRVFDYYPEKKNNNRTSILQHISY